MVTELATKLTPDNVFVQSTFVIDFSISKSFENAGLHLAGMVWQRQAEFPLSVNNFRI